jgi:hypothetical protein
MKNFRPLVLGLVLVSLVTPLKAETVMYCSTELATGFYRDKDNGSWGVSRFNEKRYTIKFDEAFSKAQGISPLDTFQCEPRMNKEHMIICSSGLNDGESFGLNRNTGRFFYSNANIYGFISDKADVDTDVLSAGTCTKF